MLFWSIKISFPTDNLSYQITSKSHLYLWDILNSQVSFIYLAYIYTCPKKNRTQLNFWLPPLPPVSLTHTEDCVLIFCWSRHKKSWQNSVPTSDRCRMPYSKLQSQHIRCDRSHRYISYLLPTFWGSISCSLAHWLCTKFPCQGSLTRLILQMAITT